MSAARAALTSSLLESELFGHEKGAFTGAVAEKKGRLEVAEGGTVFLDEIGEMAPGLQAKMLRVIEQREMVHVGGHRVVSLDVRVIAATNRDLAAEVKKGAFREDLYHRLNVIALRTPPLRERKEDIPALARHFVARAATLCNRRVTGNSPEAERALAAYDWPGNIRELETPSSGPWSWENRRKCSARISPRACSTPPKLPAAATRIR